MLLISPSGFCHVIVTDLNKYINFEIHTRAYFLIWIFSMILFYKQIKKDTDK